MPIVRVRHPNITGRVFWIIPKAIPEYHNSQNIMKSENRLSYNLSGDLDDQTVMYAPKSFWRVLHYENDTDPRIKLVMNVGWSSVHTKIDYNIRRNPNPNPNNERHKTVQT
ncbi:MAG: hypothetical protein ACRCU6_02905 [Fusobacteriaceae bacterium]